MPQLLRHPPPPTETCIHEITPGDAGWDYVGFSAHRLAGGASLRLSSGSTEVCVVLLSGTADLSAAGLSWPGLVGRESVFDQVPPFAMYVPPGQDYEIVADSAEVEVGICSAPARGVYPARLIRPSALEYIPRGRGTNQRLVCNILFDRQDAEKLLVVEVFTPPGHWSSYPPHKHDTDTPGSETRLEETYYHRLNPPQGFVFQRVYTDDLSIDETMSVPDRALVLVPEGYHPVGVPHGYESYYLNTMAGPTREWIFRNDPRHEWMLGEAR